MQFETPPDPPNPPGSRPVDSDEPEPPSEPDINNPPSSDNITDPGKPTFSNDDGKKAGDAINIFNGQEDDLFQNTIEDDDEI